MAFTADLRDAVYTILLEGWVEEWPDDVPGYAVDFAEDDEGMRLIRNMVNRLHDVFHAAAWADWPGGDNPKSAVIDLMRRATRRYYEIIDANPTLNKGNEG